jgi:hypothetical protein
MIRKTTVVMNAIRKPIHVITDRAKRYRANSNADRPPGRKQCGYCGSLRNVDHIDGNEDHGDPRNLMYACKRCNAKKAALMKKAGIGKLTRQFNPGRRRGSRADQMKAYGDAIKVMRGQFEGDVSAAVATIRATPPDVRSAYTSRTWAVRKQLYGPSGRAQGALPF